MSVKADELVKAIARGIYDAAEASGEYVGDYEFGQWDGDKSTCLDGHFDLAGFARAALAAIEASGKWRVVPVAITDEMHEGGQRATRLGATRILGCATRRGITREGLEHTALKVPEGDAMNTRMTEEELRSSPQHRAYLAWLASLNSDQRSSAMRDLRSHYCQDCGSTDGWECVCMKDE